MSVHDFERMLDEKVKFKAYSEERGRQAHELGQKLFAFPQMLQSQHFIPEAGITLADRQPTLRSEHRLRTPFINYYGVDITLEARNGNQFFELVVNPEAKEVSQAECKYATIYGRSSPVQLEINGSVTDEARQKAEEEVVEIFEAFVRCFGVDY